MENVFTSMNDEQFSQVVREYQVAQETGYVPDGSTLERIINECLKEYGGAFTTQLVTASLMLTDELANRYLGYHEKFILNT